MSTIYMKRKNNLYKDIYKFENILYCFNEVCKNTKNKRKVEEFKRFILVDVIMN